MIDAAKHGGPGQHALKAKHFLFDFSYNWR
jgi:hypothetical protein